MNKIIIALVLLCLPFCMLAQKKYPQAVMPGQTETLTPTADTLWVMKHSQMQKAIEFAKQNKILKEQVGILESKVGIGGELSTEKDSLMAVYKKDAEYYKGNWNECDTDFKKVAKKYKQQKFLKNLGFIGMGVTFLLGAYLL